MGILVEEIKYFYPKNVTNSASKGGISSNNEIPDQEDNIFPAMEAPDKVSGGTWVAKIFLKLDNSNNHRAINIKCFFNDITAPDSFMYFLKGTQRNTLGDITGAERKYGVGRINADINMGESAFSVNFEAGNGANNLIQAGDLIHVNDGTQSESLTVDTVTMTADQVAITTTKPFENSFLLADNSVCASVAKDDDVGTSQDLWAITSTAGTYDEAGYPLVLSNLGTEEMIAVFTMTSTTDFSCVTDNFGELGNGNIATDFSPLNPKNGEPFFTLKAAGFGGAFVIGETFSIPLHPSSLAFWLAYNLPVNSTTSAIDPSKIISLVNA